MINKDIGNSECLLMISNAYVFTYSMYLSLMCEREYNHACDSILVYGVFLIFCA